MIPAGLFLVDTSAIARVSSAGVRAELIRLGKLGSLATCPMVDLEVLYSARDPKEYRAIADRRRKGFTDLPLLPELENAPEPSSCSFRRRASIVRRESSI